MRYFEFIEICKNKKYENLTIQIHHIIPKSQGGTDDEKNKIKLSVHDHFWAHVYYTEETGKCGTSPQFILKNYKAKKSFTEKEWDIAYKKSIELLSKAMKGKLVSDETRKKMSYAAKNRIVSLETRKKISESHKGLNHSEESKKKMSQLKLGKKQDWERSDKWKKRQSESQRGKKRSIEFSELQKKNKTGLKWFNNGSISVQRKECPEGFNQGMLPESEITRSKKKISQLGFHFFNNGIITVRCKECPGGFKPGMLRKNKWL